MAADFVSVLKKALDKYGEPALDTRKRIYDGARSALDKKLAEFSPPLSPEVINKQKRSLEDAITSVERDYAKSAPVSDPLAELEDIFSSIDRNKNQSSHVRPAGKDRARKAGDACRQRPSRIGKNRRQRLRHSNRAEPAATFRSAGGGNARSMSVPSRSQR